MAANAPKSGPALVQRANRLLYRLKGFFKFSGSAAYWEDRYNRGGNSGSGSYGRLAEFKAEVLNRFVAGHAIQSVIEFGCGDGHQLSLAHYPRYIGLDVSAAAVAHCGRLFAGDPDKSFFLYNAKAFIDRAGVLRADLALSLDVIFHLVEEEVFEDYMRHLFAAANRYVIVYSSDYDGPQQIHERHHQFSAWVAQNRPEWQLLEQIKNPYPYDPADPGETSQADFFIFELMSTTRGNQAPATLVNP